MNQTSVDFKFEELRQRAEQLLAGGGGESAQFSEMDILSLIHELEVHHVELQIQNEDLRSARGELEESRNRYAELYQHAPMGYIDLTADGLTRIFHEASQSAFPRWLDRTASDLVHIFVPFFLSD